MPPVVTRDFENAAIEVMKAVAQKYPQAYRNAHKDENQHPEAFDFVILLTRELTKRDSQFGLNGKRGNEDDISSDAFAFGEGRDVLIIDFIAAAGEHGNNLNALKWQDVTRESTVNGVIMGVWVDPFSKHPYAVAVPNPIPEPTEPIEVPPKVIIKEVIKSLPDRRESMDEMIHLHNFYKVELKRPDGLWIHGGPDFEGIAAWFMDVYLNARMQGKSPEEARQMYVNEIRQSHEWKEKNK